MGDFFWEHHKELIPLMADEGIPEDGWGPDLHREPFVSAMEWARQWIGRSARPRALWRRCPLGREGEGWVAMRSPGEPIPLHIVGEPEGCEGGESAIFLALTLGALEGVDGGAPEGDLLRRYALAVVGGRWLDAVGRRAWERVKADLRARGETLAPSLGPGEGPSWPLKGQRALGALLDLGSVGMGLNGHQVLFPSMSLTAAAAVIPEEGAKGGLEGGWDKCLRCALRGRCGWGSGKDR